MDKKKSFKPKKVIDIHQGVTDAADVAIMHRRGKGVKHRCVLNEEAGRKLLAELQEHYSTEYAEANELCQNCRKKLVYREIETIMTQQWRREGHNNPELCNHWAYGCPDAGKRDSHGNDIGCREQIWSTRDGAKRLL